jgi:hypothetical protein
MIICPSLFDVHAQTLFCERETHADSNNRNYQVGRKLAAKCVNANSPRAEQSDLRKHLGQCPPTLQHKHNSSTMRTESIDSPFGPMCAVFNSHNARLWKLARASSPLSTVVPIVVDRVSTRWSSFPPSATADGQCSLPRCYPTNHLFSPTFIVAIAAIQLPIVDSSKRRQGNEFGLPIRARSAFHFHH